MTMLVEGWVVACDCSSFGTWISSTFRSMGCVIMKITSSTRSTSMNGVMLMSLFIPPPPAVAMAMLVPPFLRHRGGRQGLLVGDGRDHRDAGFARHRDRFLDLFHLEVLV